MLESDDFPSGLLSCLSCWPPTRMLQMILLTSVTSQWRPWRWLAAPLLSFRVNSCPLVRSTQPWPTRTESSSPCLLPWGSHPRDDISQGCLSSRADPRLPAARRTVSAYPCSQEWEFILSMIPLFKTASPPERQACHRRAGAVTVLLLSSDGGRTSQKKCQLQLDRISARKLIKKNSSTEQGNGVTSVHLRITRAGPSSIV